MSALPVLASAQARTFQGIVKDSAGVQPVAGVSVSVKGKGAGTTTGSDGKWMLRVTEPHPVLVFSFVGYKRQEVQPADSSTFITVRLATDVATLNAMVVTGYTTQSKVKTVGSLSTIPGTTLQNVPVASFDVMLQGRVPGLYVGTPTGQPGESGRITLRGMGSINGDVQPLYILDGVQVSNSSFSGLNPDDFESVVVLKDAAGTAQYGSRAANGVIVITTKKGRAWADGKTKVEFKSYLGASRVNSSKWDQMNTGQRLQFEEMIQDPNLPGWKYSPNNPARPAGSDQLLDSLRKINTDWRKYLLRTGLTQSDALSLSGGNANTNFYISMAYLNQQGVALNSGIERYSLRGNVQHTSGRLKSTLSMGLVQSQISYIQNEGVAPTAGGGAAAGGGGISANNPIAALYFALPYEKPDVNNTGVANFGSDALNEYANSSLKDIQLKSVVSLNEVFRLTGEWQLTSTTGLEYQQDKITDYLAPNSYFGQQVGNGNQGMYQDSLTTRYRLVANGGVRYLHPWEGNNEIEVNLLEEANRLYGTYFGFTGYGLVSQLGNTPSAITQGTPANNFIPNVAGSTIANNLLISSIALFRYSMGSKYSVTASLRRDGSSQVPAANRYINLWAVGGKWNILAEHFMDRAPVVSTLRLRGSYGLTANAGGFASDYGYRSLYGVTNYGGAPALAPQTPGNPAYNWEYNQAGDIGLEYGVLHNRIYGELDIYNRVTNHLFVNKNLSLTSGWSNVAANLGRVRNRGVEWELNADVVKRTGLTVTVGLNFAYNKNTVLSLGGDQQQFIDNISINRVGDPLGTFYAVRWAGVDPATGAPRYLDKNGKVTTTYSADNAVPLKAVWDPPYKGGVSLTVVCGRFEASALFSFIHGMSRLSYPYLYSHSADPNYRVYNQSADMLKVWQHPGDITDFQAPAYPRQVNSSDVRSSDYVKLRNLSLNYNLPVSPGLGKHVRAIRVFAQGQNLFSWMKWKGFDPEDANDIAQYEYPMPRTVTAGLNVSF
ncbi:SusC/RagA family TonB-linked outer membrane protein [Puia dinghuensis]|uniref:SusC/RagA family TonB-linked outer membrane protein n=2 Tax=Puia dinghuensis TaxID=1792502 RepID=A0A8J2U9Q6_9BACT|nr:SusC/RagA family TonB-linked outer membrane protein [Puia dinghuensis]